MSSDDNYEFIEKPLTTLQKIENKLSVPFEFYFDIGSTFFLLPKISADSAEIAFDWLHFHIGVCMLPFY